MEAEAIDLDGEGPLYQQIRRAVAGAVLSGRAAPGERLPSEEELTRRFGASRMTVNRAMAQLAADGLVLRRRKSGTVVAPRGPERAVFEIWDIGAEIARSGAAHRYELIERRLQPADAAIAERLGVAPGAEVLFLLSRHLADGAIVQVEERFINLSVVPQAKAADFAAVPPGRWLIETVPWTQAEHAIRAAAADPDRAALAGQPPGAPMLVVERRTWNGDAVVTLAELWHPQTHRLVGRFAPAAG